MSKTKKLLSLLKLLFIASLTSRFNLYQRCVYTGNSLEFVSELRVHDTNTLSVHAVCKKNKQKPPQKQSIFLWSPDSHVQMPIIADFDCRAGVHQRIKCELHR